MSKKLTVSLDQTIIEKAKLYAKSNNTSLSKLIESYFNSLTQPASKNSKITPLVESLSGVIELPADYDEKKEYADYIMKKYK
ncbi:hypothetical protein G3O08_02965 [Cryomorpha ignava]|uniref:Antitoxin n=1 Tax=Cryomorpha ignava TaxID=101383 RepID=A0A7K3WNM5_9FLAO|nr:DUF6364 family protein [Cryomorpha ignava]NEN22462.1 hypothetical protein [Cryomorpha ignava]